MRSRVAGRCARLSTASRSRDRTSRSVIGCRASVAPPLRMVASASATARSFADRRPSACWLRALDIREALPEGPGRKRGSCSGGLKPASASSIARVLALQMIRARSIRMGSQPRRMPKSRASSAEPDTREPRINAKGSVSHDTGPCMTPSFLSQRTAIWVQPPQQGRTPRFASGIPALSSACATISWT